MVDSFYAREKVSTEAGRLRDEVWKRFCKDGNRVRRMWDTDEEYPGKPRERIDARLFFNDDGEFHIRVTGSAENVAAQRIRTCSFWCDRDDHGLPGDDRRFS